MFQTEPTLFYKGCRTNDLRFIKQSWSHHCFFTLNVQKSLEKCLKNTRRIVDELLLYDLHSALFDHSADVVQVVSKSTNCQTQHLDLCLCPFGSEDEDTERTSASASLINSLITENIQLCCVITEDWITKQQEQFCIIIIIITLWTQSELLVGNMWVCMCVCVCVCLTLQGWSLTPGAAAWSALPAWWKQLLLQRKSLPPAVKRTMCWFDSLQVNG